MTPPRPSPTVTLALLTAVAAAAFCQLVVLAFVMAPMQASLGLAVGDMAWVSGLTFAAAAVGGAIGGRLVDRGRVHAALAIATVVPAVGALMTAAAGGPGSLCAARMVAGLGAGGAWSAGQVVMAALLPPERRGRAAGVLQAASPLGLMVAAVLGCFVAPTFADDVGWRVALAWSAVPALLVFFIRAAVPELPRAVHAAVTAADGASSATAARGASTRHATVALFVLLVLQMAGFWCGYGWMPTFLRTEHHATPAFIGWFQLATGVVYVFGDVFAGRLADRFGLRRVYAAFALLYATGLAALALCFPQISGDPWLLVAVVAGVGVGGGVWAVFGPLYAELLPPHVRSTTAGASYNLARASQLVVQPLALALRDITHTYASVLLLAAACAAVGGLLVVILPRGASGSRTVNAGKR